MVGDPNRGRRPNSMQRRRPGTEADLTRVRIPDTLLANAATRTATTSAKKRLQDIDTLEWVLSHLGDGDVEKIYHERDNDSGFDVSVKVEGKWYHLHITILPTGESCA